MEFEVDVALIQAIESDEYPLASAAIREVGAVNAYRRSCERHDERLANASDAKSLACRAGCYWCCYFSVDVRPVEVFNIVEFIANNLSAEEKSRVLSEIAANASLLKNLSEFDRAQKNIKCPFLNGGRCTIYSARPQTCRNYHATDAAGCKKSFEEPENLDIDPDFAPAVYQTGGAHVDAFSKVMLAAGYDIDAYELNTALHAALADLETCRRRFDDKEKVFPELESIDVPFEFISTDP